MIQLKFSEVSDGDILQSSKDYAIEFDTETILDNVKNTLGSYFQKVGSTVGILNYKNYVGISHIYDKRIQVISGKISLELYDLLLKEVVEKMAQLPFDFNSPTYEYFEIRDQTNNHVLYHLYLILKYLFFDAEVNLQSSLESIVRNPSRKNIYETKLTEVWNIDKVTSQVFSSMIYNSHFLIKVPSDNRINQTIFARKLKEKNRESYFPIYADSVKLNNSFDTMENRFVKQFLYLAKNIIEEFLAVVNSKKDILNINELVDTCNDIHGSLEEWLLHDIFAGVGEMKQIPFDSTIMHKREGYKEIFQFYNMLYSSLQLPLSSHQVTTIIENKDIAELYEIWTYFKTLNIIEETFNIVPESAIIVQFDDVKTYLKNSIHVTYKLNDEKLKIWYNKTFKNGKGSYSLTLRPDIVIEYKGKRFILDAKFKLENMRGESYLNYVESSFTFKNSDIYKMHTYKDAINDVSIACIFYPNDTCSRIQFFKDGDKGDGVGAIPLLPNKDLDEFKLFLKKAIL